jgi:hypothetical protein
MVNSQIPDVLQATIIHQISTLMSGSVFLLILYLFTPESFSGISDNYLLLVGLFSIAIVIGNLSWVLSEISERKWYSFKSRHNKLFKLPIISALFSKENLGIRIREYILSEMNENGSVINRAWKKAEENLSEAQVSRKPDEPWPNKPEGWKDEQGTYRPYTEYDPYLNLFGGIEAYLLSPSSGESSQSYKSAESKTDLFLSLTFIAALAGFVLIVAGLSGAVLLLISNTSVDTGTVFADQIAYLARIEFITIAFILGVLAMLLAKALHLAREHQFKVMIKMLSHDFLTTMEEPLVSTQVQTTQPPDSAEYI